MESSFYVNWKIPGSKIWFEKIRTISLEIEMYCVMISKNPQQLQTCLVTEGFLKKFREKETSVPWPMGFEKEQSSGTCRSGGECGGPDYFWALGSWFCFLCSGHREVSDTPDGRITNGSVSVICITDVNIRISMQVHVIFIYRLLVFLTWLLSYLEEKVLFH